MLTHVEPSLFFMESVTGSIKKLINLVLGESYKFQIHLTSTTKHPLLKP